MALRHQAQSSRNAQPGQILLAIHEFVARSSDEISLSKGDRIELIEKDDDFGDGWYLGRHLQNGSTGLFPEVYTTCAPKGAISTQSGKAPGGPHVATQQKSMPSMGVPSQSASAPVTPNVYTPQKSPSTPTVVEPKLEGSSNAPPSSAAAAARASATSNSTVMNETLSVIDEHMQDMRKPGRSVSPRLRRATTTDSVSEYSAIVESARGSYIQGSETDEEESGEMTEQEIKKWSPQKVASYLESVGVDKSHSRVFREQEFSGEVILGMEQSMIFLKELDLGPVGRRLKTWQKIKALQDAVAPPKPSQTRRISETSQSHSRRASAGSIGMLSQMPPFPHRGSHDQIETHAGQTQSGRFDVASPLSMISGSARHHSPRPSAASVRSLGHSRRQSSIDQSPNTSAAASPPTSAPASHQKQPSLDRAWNLSAATQSEGIPRPRSQHTHTASSDRPQFEKRNSSALSINTVLEPDRGYVSGSEVEGPRQRRVLTKRQESAHNRASSYETGKRRSTLLGFKRSSAQSSPNHSTNEISGPIAGSFAHAEGAPAKSPKKSRIVSEPGAPSVTKLDYTEQSPRAKEPPVSNENESKPSRGNKGLRAISDAVTGREKALHTIMPDSTASPTASTPHSAGSSTPSKDSRSLDADGQTATPSTLPSTSGTKRKSKKATSAYTRGLERKSPQEQMAGAEYSGWMKKKSSNLMTNWKPRLFVLRGRRLSYYYSEMDTEEKGLIDISGHRVLPADNERLTGLHATITKATSNPNSPQVSNANGTFSTMSSGMSNSPMTTSEPNSASVDGSAAPSLYSGTTATSNTNNSAPPTPLAHRNSHSASNNNNGFIFKLVPPRAGLSKAVNFTKPTVHYFAVPSVQEGRLWMAALMKATIDRDEASQVVTTYTQKTITLSKARARKERPPEFMNEDGSEAGDKVQAAGGALEDGGGPGSASASLGPVEEVRDQETREEEDEQERKSELQGAAASVSTGKDEPEPQMREVTDLETEVSRRSLVGSAHQHTRNKSSTGSGGFSKGGLGIRGLNGITGGGGGGGGGGGAAAAAAAAASSEAGSPEKGRASEGHEEGGGRQRSSSKAGKPSPILGQMHRAGLW